LARWKRRCSPSKLTRRNQKLLDAIFRGAHTLKGNAGSLGYPKVGGFAHVFEEMLQRFRNRTLPVTQGRITLLLHAVDALRQMIPEAIAGSEELQAEHVALRASTRQWQSHREGSRRRNRLR
jgi:chemotaxis protein histidine kinase CheA